MTLLWLPASEECELASLTGQEEKIASRLIASLQTQIPKVRLTTQNITRKPGITKKVHVASPFRLVAGTASLGCHLSSLA